MKKIWSLQHDGNSYNDDCFNGTFEECVEYAKKLELEPEQYQVALIEIDEDGIVTYTHEVVKGTEI